MAADASSNAEAASVIYASNTANADTLSNALADSFIALTNLATALTVSLATPDSCAIALKIDGYKSVNSEIVLDSDSVLIKFITANAVSTS